MDGKIKNIIINVILFTNKDVYNTKMTEMNSSRFITQCKDCKLPFFCPLGVTVGTGRAVWGTHRRSDAAMYGWGDGGGGEAQT